MFFDDNKQNVSSIRCNGHPGGYSSIKDLNSIEGENQLKFSTNKRFPDSKVNYNIVNLQSKENDAITGNTNPQRICSKKTGYEIGKGTFNLNNGVFPNEAKQSSIKILQTPGGNSIHNDPKTSSIKVLQMPGGNSHVRYAAQQ